MGLKISFREAEFMSNLSGGAAHFSPRVPESTNRCEFKPGKLLARKNADQGFAVQNEKR